MLSIKDAILHVSPHVQSDTKTGNDPCSGSDYDPDPEPNKDSYMGNNQESSDTDDLPEYKMATCIFSLTR